MSAPSAAELEGDPSLLKLFRRSSRRPVADVVDGRTTTSLVGETAELSRFRTLLFRPHEQILHVPLATAPGEQADDRALVERIIAAYRRAQELGQDTGSGWSDHYGGRKRPMHHALVRADVDEVATLLRNPISNQLFFGFDGLCAGYGYFSEYETLITQEQLYDQLARLGEAIGATNLWYPEAGQSSATPPTVDVILSAVSRELRKIIRYPNPYPGEVGLQSLNGIMTFRALQAIYQATLVHAPRTTTQPASVVEIGGGLGRTAFYAVEFGARNYTLVDLPMTNVAQAYFLGRALGPDAVSLSDESRGSAAVRIIPSAHFFVEPDRYGLALNVDSLPEMGQETAQLYVDVLSQRTPRLTSVNHEYLTFAARELRPKTSAYTRQPYLMRKGYVLEQIDF